MPLSKLKPWLGLLAGLVLALSAGPAAAAPGFRLGLVTDGSADPSIEDYMGARALVKLYGAAEEGGLIRHLLYPANFVEERDRAIDMIASLADDPLVKVVVVNQAIPGTAEAFRRIREKRPEILLLAGESHEDPADIAAAADLVVNADFISQGYLIPYAAAKLGARNLVHISFPRHLGYETISRRLAIMGQVCADLSLVFAREEAPDPKSEVGTEAAKRFITDKFPEWLKKYGPETAFFCTNDAQTEPLIRQVAKLGGFFIEADVPSPLMGYPEAFGLDLGDLSGDWPEILRRVEDAALSRRAGGRLGTWAHSLGFNQTTGLAEFGKLIVEGRAKLTDTRKLLESFGKFSPGGKWNGTYFIDPLTGKPLRSYFLIYQDTYILGRGFLGLTDIKIPEKYLLIGAEARP